jgi:deoxyribonuclease-4
MTTVDERTPGSSPAHAPALPRERIRLPDGRRAGAHLPVGSGLLHLAQRTWEIGASCVQIFSDNPTAWQRRQSPPPDAEAFRQRLAELDVAPVAIHASYLINLAGPNDDLWALSIGLLRHELEHSDEYGARFVNLHIGSHRGTGVGAGIARLTEGLRRATDGLDQGGGPLIVLENSSGGGASIGAGIEEMAAVLDGAAARGLDRLVGFCLDVAHLWGAGYDVADPDTVDATLAEFDRLIGLSRLAMIHINDSHSLLGSRHDRHAHIGEGMIGRRGLTRFLTHPGLAHAAFYLETPETDRGYDAVNVARLEDLVAGRPLTPGPTGRASEDETG